MQCRESGDNWYENVTRVVLVVVIVVVFCDLISRGRLVARMMDVPPSRQNVGRHIQSVAELFSYVKTKSSVYCPRIYRLYFVLDCATPVNIYRGFYFLFNSLFLIFLRHSTYTSPLKVSSTVSISFFIPVTSITRLSIFIVSLHYSILYI